MKFEYEYLNSKEEVIQQIRRCEGFHTQQTAYSTFHDALTQICFGCRKIRTNIKVFGKDSEEEKNVADSLPTKNLVSRQDAENCVVGKSPLHLSSSSPKKPKRKVDEEPCLDSSVYTTKGD